MHLVLVCVLSRHKRLPSIVFYNKLKKVKINQFEKELDNAFPAENACDSTDSNGISISIKPGKTTHNFTLRSQNGKYVLPLLFSHQKLCSMALKRI